MLVINYNYENIQNIINEFQQIENVKAISLAGSRAANSSDKTSDYDIYVYSDTEIDIQKRENIAKNFQTDMKSITAFLVLEMNGL